MLTMLIQKLLISYSSSYLSSYIAKNWKACKTRNTGQTRDFKNPRTPIQKLVAVEI